MKIVLISCVKQKQSEPCKAVDMYISPLFRGGLRYAKLIGYDKLFILSAKYGLLKPEEKISPYNSTLKSKSENEKKLWSVNILNSLRKEGVDFEKDEIIILAGIEYRKYIISKFKNYKIPLKGLSLGNQLKYYNNVLHRKTS